MLKLPQDFIDKYQNLLGDEAEAFFDSLNDDVQKGFRLNPLKNDYQNVDVSLDNPIPFIKDGYFGQISGKSLDHQAGYVYSQDISAMYVGQIVAATPGDYVLDLCAAPGGKSTHIAQQLQNQGLLVSNEINHKRAEILVENLERFGALNTIILNETPQKIAEYLPATFDKVVVDAPCSGEGMFRKDHDAIKYWNKNYPAECAERQKKILQSAIRTVKPGGQLIYSTCTFSPEEDEQVVQWVLDNYPEFKLVEIPRFEGMDAGRPDFANQNSELKKCVRLMPHHFQGEGQFIAKFINCNESLVKRKPLKKKKKQKNQSNQRIDNEQFKMWQAFIKPFSTVLCSKNKKDFKVLNQHLYYIPKESPDISQLKFMRPGLYLGEFKKNRFEPSYSLALALNPAETTKTILFTKEQWEQYLTGQTVKLDADLSNGWYLLVCDHKAFSFGKYVNHEVKNFIPKKIRFKS